MKIKQILSGRKKHSKFCFQIILEWEDELQKFLRVPMLLLELGRGKRFVDIIRWICSVIITFRTSFVFELSPEAFYNRSYNRKSIVPCIIDFYLSNEEQLKKFYRWNNNHKIVLISSMEVYEFLKNKGCPLNIKHWALSIADKYTTPPPYILERKYDALLLHRQNPVIKQFVEKYKQTHKDFRFVYCTQPFVDKENWKNKRFTYVDSDGLELGNFDTREKYLSLIKMVKCAFYSTQGIDGQRDTCGFNQVTPSFLELLACGCHVIARYPDNPDTQWYHLNDFCKSVETYEEFEAQMDYARAHEIDREKYKNYLAQHCTSKRAEQLQEILATL